MKTAIINIKVDKKEKKQAQILAKKLGFSLSSVMNAYLKDFLRKQQVNVSLKEEKEFTAEAIKALAESEVDLKTGRYREFDNWEEESAYLDSLITDAEKRTDN